MFFILKTKFAPNKGKKQLHIYHGRLLLIVLSAKPKAARKKRTMICTLVQQTKAKQLFRSSAPFSFSLFLSLALPVFQITKLKLPPDSQARKKYGFKAPSTKSQQQFSHGNSSRRCRLKARASKWANIY